MLRLPGIEVHSYEQKAVNFPGSFAASASATLRAQGRGEASFDQAKVDRVALAIRDGSYKVNAGTIADKLIANAEELLARTSR